MEHQVDYHVTQLLIEQYFLALSALGFPKTTHPSIIPTIMVTLSAKTWEKGVYIPLVEVEQFYFIWSGGVAVYNVSLLVRLITLEESG